VSSFSLLFGGLNMPRGMRRNHLRHNFMGYPFRGFYGLVDALIIVGVLYFLVKLLLVALPYALGLLILFVLRQFLRAHPWRGF